MTSNLCRDIRRQFILEHSAYNICLRTNILYAIYLKLGANLIQNDRGSTFSSKPIFCGTGLKSVEPSRTKDENASFGKTRPYNIQYPDFWCIVLFLPNTILISSHPQTETFINLRNQNVWEQSTSIYNIFIYFC